MRNVRGISKYVPLPAWNPAKAIPEPFRALTQFASLDRDACVQAATVPNVTTSSGSCVDITNFNPQIAFPDNLTYKGPQPSDGGLCAYTSIEQLSFPDLEVNYHNGVHVSVGGVMGSYFSPAALIFLPWHAYVDDVALKWECSCNRRCQTCSDVWGAVPLTVLPAANAQGRGTVTPPHEVAPIGYWWWFEDFVMPPELSPEALVDHAGFRLRGIVHGGASVKKGFVGQSLQLDGLNDFVEGEDSSIGQVASSDFTLDAWIKTSARGVQPIVSNRDSRDVGYALFLDDGKLAFSLGVEDAGRPHRPRSHRRGRVEQASFIAEATALADGAWHHVAAVVRRSDPDRSGLFVDGVPVLRFDVSELTGNATSEAKLEIGRLPAERSHNRRSHHRLRDRFFRGELDELTLVRSALSDDLVASIFIAGEAGKLGSYGGLPTWAERPFCLVQLEEAIDEAVQDGHAGAEEASDLFDSAVAAIEAGRQGLARVRLRELNALARTLVEPNPFVGHAHFHHIMAISGACLEQRPLRLE
jgi:hypothetical protein